LIGRCRSRRRWLGDNILGMNRSKPVIAAAACLAFATSVTFAAAPAPAKKASTAWRSLFDGKTTSGWRGYKSPELTGWKVAGGTLAKEGTASDILTTDQFENFELEFDWKLDKGGNAGVFYRGTEEYEKVYWSAPEYQLLDDAKHEDAGSRLTAAGAAYGLYPAPAGAVKPGGEWNSSRIVARGAHVEHWLNGKKLLEYEMWSPDWNAKIKASKFVDYPNFGLAKKGHIAIQGDHEGHLALRNLRIRELE
jgi:hypothetical protein